MPHQCVKCDEIYEDGTQKILSGCSACKGNTFKYIQKPAVSDSKRSSTNVQKESEYSEAQLEKEDSTQHSARTDIVDLDSLGSDTQPSEEESYLGGGILRKESDGKRQLKDIQDELNRQYEGIRVLQPGKYEINLTNLFNKETCVIALKENGKYVINIPESQN